MPGNIVQTHSGSAAPSSRGGAIYALNGSLTVRNSTFAENTAVAGRGIYGKAVDQTLSVEISNTIIGQHDKSVQNPELVLAYTGSGQVSVTGGNNLIRSQNDYNGITVSTDDPLLDSLADNGGPTLTHALGEGSPAIDLGGSLQNPVSDQRGPNFARIVGTAADIGAYEVQIEQPPSLPGDYNGDHSVDAADFVKWRKTIAEDGPKYFGADGNGNGTIDAADYDVWRAHFGESLPPGAAAASITRTDPPPAGTTSADAAKLPGVIFGGELKLAGAISTATRPPAALPLRTTASTPPRIADLAVVALFDTESPKYFADEAADQGSPTDASENSVSDGVWAEWPSI